MTLALLLLLCGLATVAQTIWLIKNPPPADGDEDEGHGGWM